MKKIVMLKKIFEFITVKTISVSGHWLDIHFYLDYNNIRFYYKSNNSLYNKLKFFYFVFSSNILPTCTIDTLYNENISIYFFTHKRMLELGYQNDVAHILSINSKTKITERIIATHNEQSFNDLKKIFIRD